MANIFDKRKTPASAAPATVSTPPKPELPRKIGVQLIAPAALLNSKTPLTTLHEAFAKKTAGEFDSLDELALHLSKSLINPAAGSFVRVGAGIIEARARRESDSVSLMRAKLMSARGLKTVLEVGYRSTRLDLAGDPIDTARAYWGRMVKMNEETLLLQTDFGLREFYLSEIEWVQLLNTHSYEVLIANVVILDSPEGKRVDFLKIPKEHFAQDEPREMLRQESGSPSIELAVEPFREISVSNIASMQLAAWLNQDVYVEIVSGGSVIGNLAGHFESLQQRGGLHGGELSNYILELTISGKTVDFYNGCTVRICSLERMRNLFADESNG